MKYKVTLNDKVYEVEVESGSAMLLDEYKLAVKSGDVVAVLEAMKMENEIMVSHDATIAQVLVSVSSKVDTGTPLIVLG